MSTTLAATRVTTPLGELLAFARADALCFLGFVEGRDDPERELGRRFGAFTLEQADPLDVRGCFAAYLAGDLAALDRLPVDPGGTPFQKKVWTALRAIAAGTTLSYAQIAQSVECPDGTRAVGAANGRNPIAIVVPCHRVVRSDGSLGGYGGGLDRKRWLLDHEKAWAQRWLFR